MPITAPAQRSLFNYFNMIPMLNDISEVTEPGMQGVILTASGWSFVSRVSSEIITIQSPGCMKQFDIFLN